jgi:hypothetical protein
MEKIVHLLSDFGPMDLQLISMQEPLSNLKFNLQYSLRLIEASNDYLLMTNQDEDYNEGASKGAMTELLSLISLKDEFDKFSCTKEMIKELLKDHERIIAQLQKRINHSDKYNDREAVGFVSSIIEEHKNIARKFRKYF